MKVETKWAVIISILAFLLFNLENVLGLHTPENYETWTLVDMTLGIAIFVVGYILMLREKREQDYGGLMTWKQGFWAGAITTLLLIPLSTLLVYIFIVYISPTFPVVFAEKNGMYDYNVDATGMFLTGHVISTILFGLVGSLIYPIFLKKSK
ncbi:MAG: DUF4199 domain-containing protein [Bacteroidetes bacterium]|nr:MAG: DUF4199 domain-containing protein [Bacteroidota bacterium]